MPDLEPGQPGFMDQHLSDYAGHLQKIYDERTAGDFTFLGVLSDFARTCFEHFEALSEQFEEGQPQDSWLQGQPDAGEDRA